MPAATEQNALSFRNLQLLAIWGVGEMPLNCRALGPAYLSMPEELAKIGFRLSVHPAWNWPA